MHEQATKYGVEVISADVSAITLSGDLKIVNSSEGVIIGRSVIVASGTERIKLDVPGEEEFTGRGVSFCATCDGPFFKGKNVVVVGGGNAALHEAMHLSKFANKVIIIHRRDTFRATKIVQSKVLSVPNISVLWNTIIESIEGDTKVKHLFLSDTNNPNQTKLDIDGVFVAVGIRPNTRYLEELVEVDKHGSIIVDERMETNVKGIFAAGDVRVNSTRQVVTAAGDGAQAAVRAREFLES